MAECATERHEFGRFPSENDRMLVCEWLRQHGINPNEVPVPGWIEIRPEERQIAYEAWVPGDDGQPQLDEQGEDFLRETRVVQLEEPPLPFPAGIA